MARLGENQLGNFSISGSLAGGGATTLSSATPSGAESTSRSIGGVIIDVDSDVLLAESTDRGVAGEVVLGNGSVLLADSISRNIGESEVVSAVATPSEAIRFLSSWAICDREVHRLEEEIREWDRLVLTFRTERESVVEVLRPTVDESGEVDVLDRIDGGFDAVDRARGENTVTLTPPTSRGDLRSVDTYHVEEYEEVPVGQSADRYEFEVEFIATKEKAIGNEYGTIEDPPDLTRGSNEWLFEFFAGDVVTRRVSAEIEKSPDGTFAGVELTLALELDEVRVVEESASKLNTVNFREVPDGENVLEDTHPDGHNTVQVTPPDEATDTVEPGEYVIEEYETVTESNRGLFVVTLAVSET